MSSTGATLRVARVGRVRPWQVLIIAAVLIAGFTAGIFTGRTTATKSEPIAKSAPVMTAIAPSQLPGETARLSRRANLTTERILAHLDSRGNKHP